MVYKEEGRIFNGKNCFKAREMFNTKLKVLDNSFWWWEENETKVSGKGIQTVPKVPVMLYF